MAHMGCHVLQRFTKETLESYTFKANQFVSRGVFLSRNKEIKTKRNKIFARKRQEKEKLKIMHEENKSKPKKMSKSRKQGFFPRVIFLTRINDIF